ncbi:MAG: SOS response-associated peptidase [Nannocystaceae bacterium]
MCGRMTLTGAADVARELDATFVAGTFSPRYNIAPTQPAWCLLQERGRRVLRAFRWGFSHARGIVINARAEHAAKSSIFAEAFVTGRCGVVADGFLEWSGPANRRQPTWFRRPDHKPLVFAGLSRVRVDPITDARVEEFVVITTDANDCVRPLHSRMPAILSANDLDLWLSSTQPERHGARTAFLTAMEDTLRPADPALLEAHPVSARVNHTDRDDPTCLAPRVEQMSLF